MTRSQFRVLSASSARSNGISVPSRNVARSILLVLLLHMTRFYHLVPVEVLWLASLLVLSCGMARYHGRVLSRSTAHLCFMVLSGRLVRSRRWVLSADMARSATMAIS